MVTVLTRTRRDWERVFSVWSKPPGKTEQERCDRAVRAIKDAVAADATLASKTVRTFPQGSYRNRTNVRQDSDVDVCVLCEDSFYYHLLPGVPGLSVQITPTTYKFGSYKNDVERALVNRFGRANVRRGNKAFDVNENTRRVDADAAPCFAYRLYFNGWLYHDGTALIADDTGRLVTNFPRQQYDNGVAKNDATDRRFKRAVRIVKKLSHEMQEWRRQGRSSFLIESLLHLFGPPSLRERAVRIVKKLSHEMEDAGVASARPIASFLIESLIWNPRLASTSGRAVDDTSSLTWGRLGPPSLRDMTQGVIAHLWEYTRADATCGTWREENGIKLLFHGSQSWTRAQANQFLYDAWNYVESG